MTKRESDFIGGLNMTDQISNEAYKKIMINAEEEGEKSMINKTDIQWLIELYIGEIELLEEERRTNKGIGFGDAMNCGKIGAYGRVIADLKGLLDESEEKE